MVRRYAEPVVVWRRDTDPGRFRWRERDYQIQAVQTRWTQAGAWWRVLEESAGIDDGERAFWRVEAGVLSRAGRIGAIGVFDLCLNVAGGGWTLARALD